jgi:hypothetical protein
MVVAAKNLLDDGAALLRDPLAAALQELVESLLRAKRDLDGSQ